MPRQSMNQKILVPLDFSEGSTEALQSAVRLAEQFEGSLVLLTVIDMSFPYPDLYSLDNPGHGYFESMRDRALAKMDELLAEIGSEVEAEKVIVRGRPKSEIGVVAQEVGADLIVMPKSSGGGLKRALLGSVTETVLRDAPCPILVIPA